MLRCTLLLCMTIGVAGCVAGAEKTEKVGSQPTATQPVAQDTSLIARLSDGVTIAVLGVSEHPSAGKIWWRAAGEVQPQAPYHHVAQSEEPRELRMIIPGSEPVVREVGLLIIPWANGVVDPAEFRWQFRSGGSGTSFPPAEDQANLAIPGVYGIVSEFVGPTTSLRVEIAAGPWKTVFSAPAGTGGQLATDGRTYSLEPPTGGALGTQYAFARTGIVRGLNERIVAIDVTGAAHPMQLQSSWSSGGDQRDVFTVPVPLTQLKEVQFQQRPFDEWVEIQNISLNVGKRTEVQIQTSDQH